MSKKESIHRLDVMIPKFRELLKRIQRRDERITLGDYDLLEMALTTKISKLKHQRTMLKRSLVGIE